MQRNFIRAGILAISISFVALLAWEIHLRQKDLPISYDDNNALWAHNRSMVYEPRDRTTVFIGSSRIKYDLDIPTWQSITGNHAVQLANVGSSPRPVLEDLANDEKFSGNLVIDVTEGLFFSDFSPNDALTNAKIAYYHKITPTQKWSFQVNHVLESKLMFRDENSFSINAMLDNLHIPRRQGVFQMPLFPVEFHGNSFERQSFMTPQFLVDSNLQNQVKGVWGFLASLGGPPPPTGDKLQSILNIVRAQIDKIKSRGGKVLFVRTPSSGPYRMGELKGFPRAKYWDRILAATDCPGIYFEDDPSTAHFTCLEWSHLTPHDAVSYTKSIIKSIRGKGWPLQDHHAVN